MKQALKMITDQFRATLQQAKDKTRWLATTGLFLGSTAAVAACNPAALSKSDTATLGEDTQHFGAAPAVNPNGGGKMGEPFQHGSQAPRAIMFDIASDDTNRVLAIGQRRQKPILSSDGGETWPEELNLGKWRSHSIVASEAFSFTGEAACLIVEMVESDTSTTICSTDGGQSWQKLTRVTDDYWPGKSEAVIVHPSKKNRIFLTLSSLDLERPCDRRKERGNEDLGGIEGVCIERLVVYTDDYGENWSREVNTDGMEVIGKTHDRIVFGHHFEGGRGNRLCCDLDLNCQLLTSNASELYSLDFSPPYGERQSLPKGDGISWIYKGDEFELKSVWSDRRVYRRNSSSPRWVEIFPFSNSLFSE